MPPTVNWPPTYKSLPIPTPPVTINAPVSVELAVVALVTVMARFVVLPRSVTLCNVLVFHTVIYPLLVVIAVSVPAEINVKLA